MNILLLLIPLTLLVMAVALGVFVWSVKAGQYDDMDGPAHRILFDDDDPRIPGTRLDQHDDYDERSNTP